MDKASAPFSASNSKKKRRRRPKSQCGSDKLQQERCEGWYPSVPWLMERKAELLAIMQVWESNVQPSGLSIDQYDAPTKEVGQFQRQPTTFNRLDLVFAPLNLLHGNVPSFTILSIHEYIFSPFLPFVSFVLV